MQRSIVEYCAEHEGYKCGYCGGSDSNYSHGMWAHSMTVADYQDLIDRGWRRSGKYCYKPTMDIICCPMYTIRCRALEFKASKSQKKILKRFNKYLSGEEIKPCSERKMSTCSADSEVELGQDCGEQFVESTITPQKIDVGDVFKTETIGDSEEVSSENHMKMEDQKIGDEAMKSIKQESSMDPDRAPNKKAKQLRKERKLEKLKAKGVDVTTLPTSNKNKEKQLEDFINELPDDFKHNLDIKLVRTNPPSSEYLATAAETHKVYVKYQTTVHNDKPEKCTEPKFQEFLLHSPLLEEHPETGPSCGYGSFHQQYWLRGRLIAVGVIDILPKCVSSVYFFYDPQYMNLTLGTYGALREIQFTRELNKQCPELKYYYMGYYVHTCKKMRYKGNFHPSDLLCPETYKWFPIKESLSKIDSSPYSRLDPDLDSVDENFPRQNDTNYIPCWVKGNIMHYKLYKRKANKKTDDEDIIKYSQLVGAKTLQNMILVRPKIK